MHDKQSVWTRKSLGYFFDTCHDGFPSSKFIFVYITTLCQRLLETKVKQTRKQLFLVKFVFYALHISNFCQNFPLPLLEIIKFRDFSLCHSKQSCRSFYPLLSLFIDYQLNCLHYYILCLPLSFSSLHLSLDFCTY